MDKKRVLITGGTGLLALNWACAVISWMVLVKLIFLVGQKSYKMAQGNKTNY